MKIKLFFSTLKTYFETIRFLKSNKLWFQDMEQDQAVIINYDTNVLSKVNYNFGIVK